MSKIILSKLVKPRKRLARGIAGKGGKTAGRGTKGQKSRTGYHVRLPKGLLKTPKVRGFKRFGENPIELAYAEVSAHFKSGEKVSARTLVKLGLIEKNQRAKILGPKTDDKKLTFVGVATSASINHA